MRTFLPIFVLFLPLWAQNSVTVTAGRTPQLVPDVFTFQIDVVTGVDTSREEVLAALPDSLVTATNLVDVRTSQQYLPDTYESVDVLNWAFQFNVPIANFKSISAQLTKLQQTIADAKNGMSLSFSVRGTMVSQQALLAATCSPSDLLADARARAVKLAAGTGASVGGVLAMSGTAVSESSSSSSPAYYSPTCYLTVKFALLGL